jgi:HAD superfamily hydrolase (TIGR01549 family)
MTAACKAVLWDVGGTLVEFRCALVDSVRERLNRGGFSEFVFTDEYIEGTFSAFYENEPSWRTKDDERAAALKWAKTLLRSYALSDQQLLAAADALLLYYDMYQPVAGIIDLLGELQTAGVRQAVVSNWPPSLRSFLEFHGLHSYFESVVFSAEDGVGKPDARIFHRALRGMDLLPHEAVFVGDSVEMDVVGATGVGMRCIHFDPRGQQPNRHTDDVRELRKLILDETIRGSYFFISS